MTSNKKMVVVTILGLLIMVSTTSAATITREALALDGANITPLETVIFAWNVGPQGTANATVNEITFSGSQPTEVTNFSSVDGFSTYNRTEYDDDGYSSAMLELMKPTAYDTNGADVDLTISGLVAGEDYLLQFIQDSPWGGTNNHIIDDYPREGESVSYSATVVKSLFNIEFTAISETQNFSSIASGGNHYIISGIVLSTVPEPATMGLLGMGGIAMLLKRRR